MGVPWDHKSVVLRGLGTANEIGEGERERGEDGWMINQTKKPKPKTKKK